MAVPLVVRGTTTVVHPYGVYRRQSSSPYERETATGLRTHDRSACRWRTDVNPRGVCETHNDLNYFSKKKNWKHKTKYCVYYCWRRRSYTARVVRTLQQRSRVYSARVCVRGALRWCAVAVVARQPARTSRNHGRLTGTRGRDVGRATETVVWTLRGAWACVRRGQPAIGDTKRYRSHWRGVVGVVGGGPATAVRAGVHGVYTTTTPVRASGGMCKCVQHAERRRWCIRAVTTVPAAAGRNSHIIIYRWRHDLVRRPPLLFFIFPHTHTRRVIEKRYKIHNITF